MCEKLTVFLVQKDSYALLTANPQTNEKPLLTFARRGQGRQNYSAFAALIISIRFARYSFHWGRFFQ